MTRLVPVGNPADVFAASVNLRLPSREGIKAALEHVPKAPPRAPSRLGRRYEMPVWYLTISPGTVRVSCRCSAPKVSLCDDDVMEEDTDSDAPKRGRVADFSRKARARMCDSFRSMDYSPLFEGGNFPALVTLTAPGDWESVFPTPREFKRKVNLFKKEYKRSYGRDIAGVWKMEFQRRGAPHLHILMTPPRSNARGTGESFRDWASKTWARICNARGADAYAAHVARGVDVSWEEGQRYSDPRRIAVYFDKHAGYHEKDYQNEMPQLWLDAIAAGEPGATFWGYWKLKKIQETIELTRGPGARERRPLEEVPMHIMSTQPDGLPRKYQQTETAVIVMRHLRKLARSQSYVRKTEVVRTEWKNYEVEYVDPMTGEVTIGWTRKVRKRKVNRRVQYLKNQTHGFLAVNDGEQAARDIARLLGGDPPSNRQRDYALAL